MFTLAQARTLYRHAGKSGDYTAFSAYMVGLMTQSPADDKPKPNGANGKFSNAAAARAAASSIPMSASEKRMRATGIGRASGYWTYNDACRRAFGRPTTDVESASFHFEPIMVWPQGDPPATDQSEAGS